MNQHDVEAAFLQALLDQGLSPNEKEGLIMDGKMHRAHAIDSKKKNNLDGTYTGYLDGSRPAGYIKNHFLQTETKWKYEGEVVALTVQQKQAATLAMKASQAQREQERAALYEQTAQAARKRFDRAQPMADLDTTPYLARKQVVAVGVRREGDSLLIPARDVDGKIWSVQTIFPEKKTFPDGNVLDKVFSKDGSKEGHFHVIGTIQPGQPLLVAEGYATAASGHMASGHAAIVAFDSGNLDAVVGALKARHPDSPIVILGDDDIYTVQGNAGRSKALAAAEKHQVGVVFPTFTANGKFTDFNDLHVAEGLAAVTVQLGAIKTINQGLIVDKTPANDQQQPIAHPFAERLLREQANLDAQRVAAEKKPEPVPVAPAEQVKIDEALRERIHARTRDWSPDKGMSNDQARNIVRRDLVDLNNIKTKSAYMYASIDMAEARRGIPAYRIQYDKQVPEPIRQDAMKFSPPSFDEKVIAAALVSASITQAQAAPQAETKAPFVAHSVVTASESLMQALADVEKTQPAPQVETKAPVNPLSAQKIFDDARAAQAQEKLDQEAEHSAKLFHAIAGNASIVMTMPDHALTQKEAGLFVASDLKSLGEMKNAELRQRAIDIPIAEMAHAQIQYKAELERQAPDIAAQVAQGAQFIPAGKAQAAPSATNTFDQQALADVAKKRAADQLAMQQQATLNSIERGPSRTQAPVAGKAAAPQPDLSMAMPAGIEKKYIKVKNSYHHADHTVAFVDLGQKLTTKEANAEVVRSLVAIAKARQWDSIAVKGSEEFRRAAWLAASLENLPSTGYTPSNVELADLAKKMGQQVGPKVDVSKTVPDNSIERGPQQAAVVTPSLVQPAIAPVQAAPPQAAQSAVPVQAAQAPAPAATTTQVQQPAAQASAPIKLPEGTGKLVAHGAAPYLNNPKNGESYFVTMETAQGEKTLWGKDLKKAIIEANVAIGDTIYAKKVGKEDVVAKESVYDKDGKKIDERTVDAIKNKWQVGSITKATAFANETRAAAVARHADLAPAYGVMKLAEEVAKKTYPHDESYQRAFEAGVKTAVAQMIAKGEQYPAPDIKEKQVQTKDQANTPPPKEKEIERERA